MAPETLTPGAAMIYPAAYDALLKAAADVYAAEGREEATRTAEALMTTPQPTAVEPQAPCDLDLAIRDCLATSDHPLARALLAAQDLAPWGMNPVGEQMTPEAAAICAVCTLMGPEGPIPAPDLRLGLLYQRPDSYYALHNHHADETYVIIAGSAIWTAGDETGPKTVGDAIHHPSLMPHAFRTGPEGFVALWRWSGDVNTESYTFLEQDLPQTA